jgi:hypothetical protein
LFYLCYPLSYFVSVSFLLVPTPFDYEQKKKLQSPVSICPLGVIQGKEGEPFVDAALAKISAELKVVMDTTRDPSDPGSKFDWLIFHYIFMVCRRFSTVSLIDFAGASYKIHWVIGGDFYFLRTVRGLPSFMEHNPEICLWCKALKLNMYEFDKFKSILPELDPKFGLPYIAFLFCELHCRLRITEKLLDTILNESGASQIFLKVTQSAF